MAKQYIIDANAALGLFIKLPYSDQIDQRMREWRSKEVQIFVPTLWEYECLTGLRRAVTMKLITLKEADSITEGLLALEFHRVLPTIELHRAALQWAERIGQSKVYDAHYLAVTERLRGEFWTADQRLVRAVQALGIDWVHCI